MPKFRLKTLEGADIDGITSISVLDKEVSADKSGLLELSTAQAVALSEHYQVIGQNGKELEEKKAK